MAHLFGPVASVAGMRAKLSSLEVDIDDVYSALVGFGSGTQATLVIEVVSRPAIRRARIVGEEGTLIWDWTERRVEEWSAATGEWVIHDDPPPVEGPGGSWFAENMYIEEMRGYLAAIAGDPAAYPFSLEEDKALLDALAEIERSSDDGRRRPDALRGRDDGSVGHPAAVPAVGCGPRPRRAAGPSRPAPRLASVRLPRAG
jgi:predicted dehydrogenase